MIKSILLSSFILFTNATHYSNISSAINGVTDQLMSLNFYKNVVSYKDSSIFVTLNFADNCRFDMVYDININIADITAGSLDMLSYNPSLNFSLILPTEEKWDVDLGVEAVMAGKLDMTEFLPSYKFESKFEVNNEHKIQYNAEMSAIKISPSIVDSHFEIKSTYEDDGLYNYVSEKYGQFLFNEFGLKLGNIEESSEGLFTVENVVDILGQTKNCDKKLTHYDNVGCILQIEIVNNNKTILQVLTRKVKPKLRLVGWIEYPGTEDSRVNKIALREILPGIYTVSQKTKDGTYKKIMRIPTMKTINILRDMAVEKIVKIKNFFDGTALKDLKDAIIPENLFNFSDLVTASHIDVFVPVLSENEFLQKYCPLCYGKKMSEILLNVTNYANDVMNYTVRRIGVLTEYYDTYIKSTKDEAYQQKINEVFDNLVEFFKHLQNSANFDV